MYKNRKSQDNRQFGEKLERIQHQQIKDKTDEELLLKQRLENKHAQTKIDEEEQKQELRREFATWAKWVVSIWLVFVTLVLIAVGICNYFSITLYPNTVLITLLASTTINVIALSMVIIKGLFVVK